MNSLRTIKNDVIKEKGYSTLTRIVVDSAASLIMYEVADRYVKQEVNAKLDEFIKEIESRLGAEGVSLTFKCGMINAQEIAETLKIK